MCFLWQEKCILINQERIIEAYYRYVYSVVPESSVENAVVCRLVAKETGMHNVLVGEGRRGEVLWEEGTGGDNCNYSLFYIEKVCENKKLEGKREKDDKRKRTEAHEAWIWVLKIYCQNVTAHYSIGIVSLTLRSAYMMWNPFTSVQNTNVSMVTRVVSLATVFRRALFRLNTAVHGYWCFILCTRLHLSIPGYRVLFRLNTAVHGYWCLNILYRIASLYTWTHCVI